MKQEWTYGGKIVDTQAQCPTVLQLEDRWRIYYAKRDLQNRSQPFYVDVEPGNPTEVITKESGPLLELGKPGTFDVSGIIPSSVIKHKEKVFLYYVGWTLRRDVPYHNTAGLATSEDNGASFKKAFEGPILSTTEYEPYFNGTSCVIKADESMWLNYYMSCTEWVESDSKFEPRYNLKVATSENGIQWSQHGLTAINFKSPEEGGISKASIVKITPGIDAHYDMWYCYRSLKGYRTNWDRSYKIGYATSNDGFLWQRKDHQINVVSGEGWDQQMQCYPSVIKHEDILYMFYNGNGFGKTGFGFATLRF